MARPAEAPPAEPITPPTSAPTGTPTTTPSNTTTGTTTPTSNQPTKLGPAELADLARSAGVEGDGAIAMAVAIALAESGGEVKAVNTANRNGTVDRGLWQINSVHINPQTGYTAESLLTIAGNAKAMAEISKNGTDWSPWSTWDNGAWRKFRDVAADAATGKLELDPLWRAPFDAAGEVVGDVVDAAQALAELVALLARWDTWRRILLVAGGLAAVLAGITLAGGDLTGLTRAAAAIAN